MLEPLSRAVNVQRLSSSSLPNLKGEAIECLDEVENLVQGNTDLQLIVSLNRTRELLRKERILSEKIEKTRERIEKDLETFKNLLKR